jgi:hypothetical protein
MCVSYEEEDTCVCHMRRRIQVCLDGSKHGHVPLLSPFPFTR